MRRLISIIMLEAYAAALAWLQLQGGVRTDEAKYLLNIPYPHPPLARWILGLTDGWAYQEVFWRFVFASLLVQGVWLVWDMTLGMPWRQRRSISFLWLCASAVLLQAGSIMMAPLTSVEVLVLLWLLSKFQLREDRAGWVALFWLVSLFTAYQVLLFLPIVIAIFRKMRISRRAKILYVTLPILVLALYTLTTPLVLAAMVIKGQQGVQTALLEKFVGLGQVWMRGGSLIVSIVGTIGLLRSRQWELILTLLLVSAYVFLARFDYYAILFLPLFVTGMLFYSSRWIFPAVLASEILLGVLIVGASLPSLLPESHARAVMRAIAEQEVRAGDVLIVGDFGHEWQYESAFPVHPYRQPLLAEARALVCINACGGIRLPKKWEQLGGTPIPVFIRERLILKGGVEPQSGSGVLVTGSGETVLSGSGASSNTSDAAADDAR